jgi:hypothetical protein
MRYEALSFILLLATGVTLVSCRDSAEPVDHEGDAEAVRAGARMTSNSLARLLTAGTSQEDIIRTLGAPMMEYLTGPSESQWSYKRRVSLGDQNKGAEAVGFHVTFKDRRVVSWELIPPPPASNSTRVMTGHAPDMPNRGATPAPAKEVRSNMVQVFSVPSGTAPILASMVQLIHDRSPDLEILAKHVRTVQDTEGRLVMELELDGQDQARFADFTRQNTGRSMLFAVGGIPRSLGVFTEPIEHHRFTLPLNVTK